MVSFTTVSEVLSLAIDIERKGEQFYRELSEKSEIQGEKDFFLMLAKEEKGHENVLLAMEKRLKDYVFDKEKEYLAYVEDLLNSYNLFSKNHREEAQMSPLGSALDFEKKTLLFFHAIEPLVPEVERDILSFCIEEEKQHIRRLMKFATVNSN